VNVNLLIDNIVRQTTVLVAQLATAAGGRAPLAHVAGQVFVELVRELKAQGLGNKVIADMFGLTLRTYHDRVRRASESVTERGSSLWEAVLRYARQRQLVSRADLLARFRADDEASVRGVLSDLVDSGLLFKSGRGDHTTYRAASDAEAKAVLASDPDAAAAGMVWVLLHQSGPRTAEELARELNLGAESVQRALESLLAQGRCRPEGERYRADHCVILYGDEIGWEAALFDHFQAMVTAIASKVTQGKNRAAFGDATGGSTYHFDLYPGHPKEQEVLGLLSSMRERASALRAEVEAAADPKAPEAEAYRVVFYVGQNAMGLDTIQGEQQ
jgi:DNA-binding MarR family transcriptional regulator